MRLLLITNVFPNRLQPTRGTFNLEMVRALRNGHDVEVVSPISWIDERKMVRHGEAGEFLRTRHDVVKGVPAYYPRYYYTPKVLRPCYGWFMWNSVRSTVLSVLRAHLPDAVLAYWAHPDGYVAVRAARRIGRPCVVMVGGSDVLLLSKNRARRRCILGVLEMADAVVTVSQDIKSKLCQFGLDPSKVHVVYRGVDMNQFSPGDRREARRRLGVPLDRPLLVWVGRMAPVKGLDVLVEACAVLNTRKIDFHAVLVGAGPSEEGLKAACLAQGLGESVRFVGSVLHHDLPDWYRAANVTVLSSLSEGVPNVLLESIACGTPFVASRVGGIPEIASPGIDRLVAPGNPLELAYALEQQILQDNSGVERCFLPESCSTAAERLIDVIRPLTTHAIKRPAFSRRENKATKLSTTTSPWSWRQMARRIMAAGLPSRLFLVKGPTAPRLVWLTFDDGPHPDHTPRLLDVLQANRIRATFFVVGKEVEQYPDLVRRMAEEGHSVGHHTFSHRSFDEMRNVEIFDEMRRTRELLCGLIGKSPPLFRPPHGRLRVSTLGRLWSAGQQVVLWNSDPKDYTFDSPAVLSDWLRDHPFQAGDIVLLHDNRPYAVVAIPDAVKEARNRGLDFATLEHPAIYRGD